MKWKPIQEKNRMVLVNCTGLAPFDEEKCKFCGKYGCTDRGYTLTAGDPPRVIGEAALSRQMIDKLTHLIEESDKKAAFSVVNYEVPTCVRKLKKSNALAVIDKIKACGEECHRNSLFAYGGLWTPREQGYTCPFRGEHFICQRNVDLDDTALICHSQNRYTPECECHEQSFAMCRNRREEGCADVMEKLSASTDNDYLFMLAHRFSAAQCRFCDEGSCRNAESEHYEGACSLNGLMYVCDKYASADADHAYTEGVFTTIASSDGKDDLKVFPSSDYARKLEEVQRRTLCVACRISHSIAKATGLKCLGVRRSTKNPFLNETNPLHENAIQINYLYMTNPEDMAKYNSELIAQAVFNGLTQSCQGVGCEEYQTCNFNPV